MRSVDWWTGKTNKLDDLWTSQLAEIFDAKCGGRTKCSLSAILQIFAVGDVTSLQIVRSASCLVHDMTDRAGFLANHPVTDADMIR